MGDLLNKGGTFNTALWRGILLAVLLIVGIGLQQYVKTGSWIDTIEACVTAATIALGGRGVIEGAADASRQANGDVKPGDVQKIGDGKA